MSLVNAAATSRIREASPMESKQTPIEPAALTNTYSMVKSGSGVRSACHPGPGLVSF